MKTRCLLNQLLLPMALFLVCVVAIPSLAQKASPDRYIDEVGLLSGEQGRRIMERLDEVSEAHRFDLAIVVIDKLPYGPPHLYAVDYFEEHGFGYGPDLDGAVLLLAMRERDMGFAALGFGLTAFTDQGQDYLDKLFLPHLKENEYMKGFLAYIAAVDDFLKMAKAGTPYDQGNIPLASAERRQYRQTAVAASLIIALLVALITTLVHKSKLKSLREQKYAQEYVREGSMVLSANRDVFLYRTVQKVEREQSKGSSGGGKSFSSSSGRSSTGHSSKF